ncbi:MAG: GNAT family N-acetyltransferase [Chloroflexi bacterium]|nr:GNAT family N-acetyltransferase [Chloroflexota bacterium]
MKYRLRKWEAGDEKQCREGFKLAYQPLLDECPEDYRPIVQVFIDGVVERAFDGMPEYFAQKDRISVTVADVGDSVIGYIDTWFVEASVAQIGNVFVIPSARRNGVASALMDGAERHARANGASEVILTTGHPLIEAHEMYIRRGYQLTATVASELRREVTWLKMSKVL